MTNAWTTISVLVLVIIAAAGLSGCGESEAVQASFTVEGMTCESCSKAITDTLASMDGVATASADHVSGTAEAVVVDPDVTPEKLAAEIEGLGYTVTATEIEPVEG